MRDGDGGERVCLLEQVNTIGVLPAPWVLSLSSFLVLLLADLSTNGGVAIACLLYNSLSISLCTQSSRKLGGRGGSIF